MEVTIIEVERFNRLENMFSTTCEMLASATQRIKSMADDEQWLTTSEVAAITKYEEKTIRSKKHEIGFHGQGKDLKFKKKDVMKYMESYYIRPREKRK